MNLGPDTIMSSQLVQQKKSNLTSDSAQIGNPKTYGEGGGAQQNSIKVLVTELILAKIYDATQTNSFSISYKARSY